MPSLNPADEILPIDLEIKAAKDLSFHTWNLPETKERYEVALTNLKAFRLTYVGWNEQGLQATQRNLEKELETINWEIEGTAQGDAHDPHGLMNVADHLRARFHEAILLNADGFHDLARTQFGDCLDSWIVLQNMHPDWRKDMVWQEIKLCLKGYHSLPNRSRYRYFDPKFGTPLSV